MSTSNINRQLNVLRVTWGVVKLNAQTKPLYFVANILTHAVSGLFPVIDAFLIARLLNAIVDHLSGNDATEVILQYLVLVVLSQAIQDQLIPIRRFIEHGQGYFFIKQAERLLLDKVASLDFSYHEDADFQNELQKVRGNMNGLMSFNNSLFDSIIMIVKIVTTGYALAVFNMWLLVIIVLSLIPQLLVQLSANKKIHARWKGLGQWNRLLNHDRENLLSLSRVKEVKIFGLEKHIASLWDEHFTRFHKNRIEITQSTQKKEMALSGINSIVQLGIQFWLISKILVRLPGFGLGEFQFYRSVVSNFSSAGTSLADTIQGLQNDYLYVSDYFAILSNQPRLSTSANPVVLPNTSIPKIELIDVSFKYPNTDKYILRHLNLIIEPGQHAAIVGVNGAGKTTLIKLLMRFYDPTEGSILVDGHDLRVIDLNSWYQLVGPLFQDYNTYGFYSVTENITFGQIEQASDAKRLKAAAKRSGADQFIGQLPEKYNQILTTGIEGGISISGGQWQRIALARAFFRDANVLILDEPTSAIDAEGEYQIFQEIAKHKEGKTSIIISHRFSTVRKADHIVVLDQGKIIEQGAHRELMKIKDGTYSHLFSLQANEYK